MYLKFYHTFLFKTTMIIKKRTTTSDDVVLLLLGNLRRSICFLWWNV